LWQTTVEVEIVAEPPVQIFGHSKGQRCVEVKTHVSHVGLKLDDLAGNAVAVGKLDDIFLFTSRTYPA